MGEESTVYRLVRGKRGQSATPPFTAGFIKIDRPSAALRKMLLMRVIVFRRLHYWQIQLAEEAKDGLYLSVRTLKYDEQALVRVHCQVRNGLLR